MSWMTRGAAVAVAAAGGLAVRRVVSARASGGWPPARSGGGDTSGRWHAITVNRPPDEVAPGGELPEPLRAMGDAIEVRIKEAPGGRGTELHARLVEGEPSGLGSVAARFGHDDKRRELRSALRRTRSIIETGYVLSPDKPATTKRTLLNRPLELATRHGREEGLL